MTVLAPPLFNGFFTSFALILAIGAQNAFVLRQGILRRHVVWVVLACALSDAVLIAAGVAGFGVAITAFPALPTVFAIAGTAFLVFYAGKKFLAAYRGAEVFDTNGGAENLKSTLLTVLALTWLNPHVYLDTLGLIGAVSTRYPDLAAKSAFAVGAISASFVFFFALGFGARLLSPLLKTRSAWRILDFLIGGLMLYLAIGLIRSI